MNTQPQTYSELQRILDEREDLKKHVQQRLRVGDERLMLTQLGAQAFHTALGCQGQPTLGGEA